MSRAQALNKLLIVVGLLFILLVSMQSYSQPLHHNLQVELHPGLKMIKGADTITFPKDSPRKISFLLHKDLKLTLTSTDDELTLLHPATQDEPYAEYGLSLGSQDNKVSLTYFGVIHDPVLNDSSTGLINSEGAVLFGKTFWYPFFLDHWINFEVTVQTPAEWMSLTQGQITKTNSDGKIRTSQFVEIYPQEEIYLMAGPWKNYETETPEEKKIKILIREENPDLAKNFLSVIPEYLKRYSNEIAPYPYTTFSVVENFWETGYGMPGFTLLGPTVMRLPFILTSSLPHEVLHNWWGNSVFVDYDKGNWCEGLTTYMADYSQQEKLGNDKGYRLNTLIKYMDFVSGSPEKDFPLREFRGRHNSSSQAIGYGKSMMFFHMLKSLVGPELFQKSLQHFYNANLFKKASYTDIQNSFEKVSGRNLNVFFTQWLDLPGAPEIELNEVKILKWHEGSQHVTYSLSQKQEKLFDLNIPVIWTLESGAEIRQIARLTEQTQVFSLLTPSRPVKISIDPDFNLFRSLYTEERPATLSAVFGSKNIHYFYDQGNGAALQFVQKWVQATESQNSFHDTAQGLGQVPQEGALVFVGEQESFLRFMQEQLSEQKFSIKDQVLTIDDQSFDLNQVSTVFVTRLKGRPEQTVAWVRWSPDNNPQDWAGRLTHYGSFGVLVFKGRPVVMKSTWPVLQSPLQRPL